MNQWKNCRKVINLREKIIIPFCHKLLLDYIGVGSPGEGCDDFKSNSFPLTGSGKTLAFAIPMIHTILEWRKKKEAMSQVPPGSDLSPVPTEEEVQKREHDDEEAEQEPDEDEEETKLQGADDDEEEENTQAEYDDEDFHSQELGCVKVIEDAEFFAAAGERSTTKSQANQKQPLLGLVLTPTRELAVQVKHHVDAVAQFTGMWVVTSCSSVSDHLPPFCCFV